MNADEALIRAYNLGMDDAGWTVSMPFCRVRRGRKIAPKWEPG